MKIGLSILVLVWGALSFADDSGSDADAAVAAYLSHYTAASAPAKAAASKNVAVLPKARPSRAQTAVAAASSTPASATAVAPVPLPRPAFLDTPAAASNANAAPATSPPTAAVNPRVVATAATPKVLPAKPANYPRCGASSTRSFSTVHAMFQNLQNLDINKKSLEEQKRNGNGLDDHRAQYWIRNVNGEAQFELQGPHDLRDFFHPDSGVDLTMDAVFCQFGSNGIQAYACQGSNCIRVDITRQDATHLSLNFEGQNWEHSYKIDSTARIPREYAPAGQ